MIASIVNQLVRLSLDNRFIVARAMDPAQSSLVRVALSEIQLETSGEKEIYKARGSIFFTFTDSSEKNNDLAFARAIYSTRGKSQRSIEHALVNFRVPLQVATPGEDPDNGPQYFGIMTDFDVIFSIPHGGEYEFFRKISTQVDDEEA